MPAQNLSHVDYRIIEDGPYNEPHEGLPVAGYRPQAADRVDMVNTNKAAEERVLRTIDDLLAAGDYEYDQRWLLLARDHIEQGFMALNRAVFRPDRVELPEDVGDPLADVGPIDPSD